MSHLNLQSGVPSSVGGVLVGASDFSEFTVSPGLPVGITEYGIGTQSPTAVGIDNVPLTPTFSDEGNYFFMTGQGDGSASRWGFGIDSFDGIMEFGEMLCRIYYNTLTVKNRNNVGACMSLRGLNGQQGGGADIRWSGGTVFDASVSPPHSAGVISIPAGTATAGFADIQESEQDPEWMWLRIRRTANIGDPIEDDWQFTAWYGDITAEPASVDGTVIISSLAGPRGLFALGWCAQPFFTLGDQRIAFLSYSDNPLIEPPPLPDDISAAPAPPTSAIWVERVQPLGLQSGVKAVVDGVICGATDFREFPIASGVPAGITKFALSANAPTIEGIANDVVEGNYFLMDGFGFDRWGYGHDGFLDCIPFGEMLARIYTNGDPQRRGIGPAMNLAGFVGGLSGDFDGEGGGVINKDAVDFSQPHSAGLQVEQGAEAQPIFDAPFQEPWQQGAWAWQRIRITDIGGGQSDWEVRTWYGDIEDEPDNPDGVSSGDPQAVITRPGGLGWFMVPLPAVGFEQRIAFLSFSGDPDIKPPPLPSDLDSVWTERVAP